MKKPEIAFTDNDIDILRIIPKYKDGRLDFFKFSVQNDFLVKSWEMKQKSPHIIRSIEPGDEITYHSSKEDQNPIVHIKYKDSSKHDDHRFKDVSSKVSDIKKVLDIKLDPCFPLPPLPLCKVEIKDDNITTFKKKPITELLILKILFHHLPSTVSSIILSLMSLKYIYLQKSWISKISIGHGFTILSCGCSRQLIIL